MNSSTFFTLRLFGSPSLAREDGALLSGRVAQRHRLALLALLTLSPGRRMSRDKLLAFLWPERDAEHARLLLNQSVHALRKPLGKEVILSEGDELRLGSDALIADVGAFQDALAAGELISAADLYSGPFLDGFFLPNAPEFERWVEAERERLRRDHNRVLEGLAGRAAEEGDFPRAAEWWRRRVAADPYDGRVTLQLMWSLEAAGDRAGAIQQARSHSALLREEFEAAPDPDVEALARRLRSEPIPVAARANLLRAPLPAPGCAIPTEETVPDGVTRRGGADAIRETPADDRPTFRRRIQWSRAVAVAAAVGGLAALLVGGWWLPEPSARAEGSPRPDLTAAKAIAVLPFTDLSGVPDMEYVGDGLTEEIVSALSRVRGIRVVAATSVFSLAGRHRDIRELGRLLGVRTILEGSVRTDGRRVRVTAQLIDSEAGVHFWADSYDREGTDIFAIQSDLALRIASALEAELTPDERDRLARPATVSPAAYHDYLKARYFWNRRTRGGYERAIEYFERAIQADPQYARAYAGLASVHAMQGLSGDLTPEEANHRIRAAVLKALELDGDLAEAHTVLGGYFEAYAWNPQAAERELLRALELDPGYPTAHHWYGNVLTSMGRFDEAIAAKKRAVELDPLAPVLMESLAYTLSRAGRTAEAFDALRHAIELDSTFWRAHTALGVLYEATGRLDEALRAHRRAAELAGPNPVSRTELARVLVLVGRVEEARHILAGLEAEAVRTGVYSPEIAAVLVALNDVDGALAWLERSYDQRHPQLRHVDGRRFARLEAEPRYLDLRRRIRPRQ